MESGLITRLLLLCLVVLTSHAHGGSTGMCVGPAPLTAPNVLVMLPRTESLATARLLYNQMRRLEVLVYLAQVGLPDVAKVFT